MYLFAKYSVFTIFCVLLVLFIAITVSIVVGTYKDTKKGVYGKGDWTMMMVTMIPVLLSIGAGFTLYYLLIHTPFWKV